MPTSSRASVAISQRHAHATQRSIGPVMGDLLAALLGLTATAVIQVIGDLPIAEVILLGALPVLILTCGRRLRNPLFWRIFMLILLWQTGEILTDVYRQSAMHDWLRGGANILFVAIDFSGLVMLLTGNKRRQVVFLISYAVGTFFMTKFFPIEAARRDPWKFGYATGTITLVVLFSCHFYRQRRYGMVLALLVGLIGIDLASNFRSAMLQLLITLVLVAPVIPERVGRLRLLPRVGSASRTAVLILMALSAGGAAISLVHWVTHSGLLSQADVEKNEEQERVKGSLLLGGRSEILISSRAVYDSPIVGHGSWAKEPQYREMYDQMVSEEIGKDIQETAQTIPSHSHLMGAWVDDGFLGAICWGYIFWLTVRALMRIPELRPALAPIYALLLVGFAWAILFSPLGSTTRMVDAFALVIILDVLRVTAPAPQSRTFRRYRTMGALRSF